MLNLLTESLRNPSSRHTKELIEVCYKIALSITWNTFSKKYRHLPAIKETIANIAVDTVAKIFRLDEKGELYYIKNAVEKWRESIEDDTSAKYFLTKMISRIVGQEIINFYRSNDPLYGKILDSVAYHIKSENYVKFCHLGNYYISEYMHTPSEYRMLTHEETLALPSEIFCVKEWHLKNLFLYLEANYGKFSAVLLNSLVYKLKLLYLNSFDNTACSASVESYVDVNSIVSSSLQNATKKLHISYYMKGKLSECECRTLESGLKDLSIDLLNGGINPGLYEYLLPYEPELTKDQYHQRYRNIFEYLFKSLKSDIAQSLIK
ncbi:MAG: hypothetical protein L6Q59_16065 [Ignavibacteriaceae bacterium]|nr:hypothetical protein [Ignavibacteriaceae bacterium]